MTVWLGLLALVLLVVAGWRSGGARLREANGDGPWIGLPPGGTDAADWAGRRILEEIWRQGAPGDALSRACGHDPTLGPERYVATVTDAQGADGWRVVLDPGNGYIRVQATRQILGRADAGGTAPSTVARRFERRQLSEVREAWRSNTLWGEEPGEPLSVGGNPVRLEACLDGRYAIRQQASGPAGARLHDVLVQALALPQH